MPTADDKPKKKADAQKAPVVVVKGAKGDKGTTGNQGNRGARGVPGEMSGAYLRLEAKADELTKALTGIREEMATQNKRQGDELKKRDKKIRGARITAAIAVVAALLSGYGYVQIVKVRAESRHSQCLRDNHTRQEAITAAQLKAQDFIDAQRAYLHTPPATGDLKVAELAYVESQGEAAAKAYPLRDCTTAGINAFIKNPPPPTGERCVPDGKGLCKP